MAILAPTCPACGGAVPNPERMYCATCLPEYQAEQVQKLALAGSVALAQHRAAGDDPAHGGDVGRKRGDTIARKRDERIVWERSHPDLDLDAERERFRREIAPLLSALPLSTIERALACSIRYASLIRAGTYTPHPRHYPALEALVKGA